MIKHTVWFTPGIECYWILKPEPGKLKVCCVSQCNGSNVSVGESSSWNDKNLIKMYCETMA